MARKHIQHRTIFRHNDINSGFPEQLIIRVGKGCNFRCIFCNVAENESVLSLKSSIREILAITFYKIKYSNIASNYINITISGGEPSIFQKETIFILKYFTKYFADRGIQTAFDLQSNASNINIAFANKLKELGITQALISSHAHDPKIFNDIIGVKYDTMGPLFEHGVDCLIQSGIPVTFNSIINKLNLDHYFDHIVYLHNKYPTVEIFNIGCVQPHGMASENFDRLIAPYEDILPIYSRVMAYLKFHGKQVHSHLVGPPLCYMDDKGSSMEYIHNKNLYSNAETSNQTLIQSINDDNKKHVSSCYDCRSKRVCSGIWKEFEGVQNVKTIPYDIFLHSFKNNVDISNIVVPTLKKMYDGGERQFFIKIDEIQYRPLIKLIADVKHFGENWIVLIINNDNLFVNKYEDYSSVNIQVPYSKLSNIELNEIQRFNASVTFQFRIQVDIIYDLPNMEAGDVVNIHAIQLNDNTLIRIPRKWKSYFLGRPFIYYFIPKIGK